MAVIWLIVFLLTYWQGNARAFSASSSSSSSSGQSALTSTSSSDHYSTLVIIEHPSNATVVELDPVTLNCKAAVVHNDGKNDIGIKSRDPVMIEWFHEGAPVLGPHGDDHRIVLPDGSLFFLRALRGIDDGNYWCVASNLNLVAGASSSNRVARSRNATLRVSYLGKSFRSEPSDTEGDEGRQLLFHCEPPDGYPNPMVTWKRNDEYVNLDSRINIQDGNLFIQKLFKEDEGTYQCIVSNMAGRLESVTAKLHVRRPPYFTKSPRNTTVRAGEDVMLPCAAQGDPPPKTRWLRVGPGFPIDGVPLDLPNFKVVPEEGLFLKHVLPSQDGFYECQAISVVGTNSKVVKLNVHKAPVIVRRPVKEVVVPLDGMTTLECNATGNPRPVLLWMRERDRTVLLPGDRTDTGLEVKLDGALSLTSIRATSTYVCLVANVVGSAVARSTVSLGTRMGDMLENPNQPASVHIQNVQGTSSSSIKVSWKLDNTGGIQSSSSSNTNQVNTAEVNTVDGFYILYRSCIGEPPGFTSITVLHAAATSYVVNRLEPYTPYEFLVIPFHRGLSGKPSALHRAQTLEARPNLAPIQLQWYQVNTSSVDVTWKPVSEEGFRGLPLGYQVLILQAGGRLAMNRSLPYDSPHLLMSNLEPRHTYYIQVAAFNSRGTGPFSETLEVRPEPSLAHLGSPAGISDGTTLKGVAWVTPLIIGFVVAIALIATAALVYVKRAASNLNTTSNKLPVNLTPILFGGRDQGKKTVTPNLREFQLVSGQEGHTQHVNRRRKTVSIWGLSNTLNRMWKKNGHSRFSGNRGCGRNEPHHRRRQSIHVSHGLTSEEESDYAYIDRSTHSITGYLNGRGRWRPSSHAPHHSTLSTCADSLSPYATTHVLHHHHHHHHMKRHKLRHQPLYSSFHTLPRRHQPLSGSLQPLSVTTFLVPSSQENPALSDPGGVATLGRRHRLSSSRITEASDHIYARVQPKDKRISTASSASMVSGAASASATLQPPNLLDLIPPPPTYPPSPRSPLIPRPRSKQSLCNNRRSRASTVASDATEETSRLLMTEECEGSLENGYAKLKWNKNKVALKPVVVDNVEEITSLMTNNNNTTSKQTTTNTIHPGPSAVGSSNLEAICGLGGQKQPLFQHQQHHQPHHHHHHPFPQQQQLAGIRTNHHPVVTSTTAEQQPDNNTSAKNFPRKSRKLDPGQDLTPDIVTWLPVLLTASNPGCQLTNETSKETSEAAATTSSTTAITTTASSLASASASASKNKVKVDDQNGQKTLVEDGLVFRSPEMKRSLRRNKKKKLSKKSPRPRNTTTTASGAGGGGGCSSSSSDNNSEEASADSFCETLKRHRRKPNKK